MKNALIEIGNDLEQTEESIVEELKFDCGFAFNEWLKNSVSKLNQAAAEASGKKTASLSQLSLNIKNFEHELAEIKQKNREAEQQI